MLSEEEIKDEMARLAKEIAFYDKLYFSQSISLISDYDYDKLVLRLEELEKKYPQFKSISSPTNSIGEKTTEGFEKVHYNIPMLSLKKTYSIEEVWKFCRDAKKYSNITFFCELKLDGISINVNYKFGQLTTISTRGDGNVGDDITCNKNLFVNIPNYIEQLKSIPNVDLRGEALMTFEHFKQLNEELISLGLKPMANPRNTVSGSLKTLCTDQNTPQRNITALFYDLYCEGREELFKTRVELEKCFKDFNIPFDRHERLCGGEDDVKEFIDDVENKKDSFLYPIDGVVIKINELSLYDTFGYTNKSPRWAIAFKYRPEEVTSQLLSVEYQVGRGGVITPIAVFNPVQLAGTIVKRASLYNEQNMTALSLCEDDVLIIQKSGEIIPRVVGVDMTKRVADGKKISFITHCPSCGELLVNKNGICFCINVDCKAKKIAKITYFVSRDAMNIKTLGEKVITLLVNSGLVDNIADIYTLKFRDVARLPGMNIVSTQKLFNEIEKSKSVTFNRVLYSLGIDGVGQAAAENIAKVYNNISQLQNAKKEDLRNIKLVGNEIVNNIFVFLNKKENQILIECLQEYITSL